MTTNETKPANVNAAYVVNPVNGETKVIITKEKESKKQVKVVAAFAKNTRYSIYNNGGGYTGL